MQTTFLRTRDSETRSKSFLLSNLTERSNPRNSRKIAVRLTEYGKVGFWVRKSLCDLEEWIEVLK